MDPHTFCIICDLCPEPQGLSEAWGDWVLFLCEGTGRIQEGIWRGNDREEDWVQESRRQRVGPTTEQLLMLREDDVIVRQP